MKLHLPTALFALAVLPAVAFAEEKTPVVATDTAGNTLIQLGEAQLTGETIIHQQGAHEDNFEHYTPTEIKNGKATLVLDGYDKVGYFTDGNLQTSGDESTQTTATNILYVHGNVELSGNAQVQANGKITANYRSGMVADAVVVSENAKMNLGSAKFESLEIGGNAHVIMENTCDNGVGVGGFWEDLIYNNEVPGYQFENAPFLAGQVARSMTITGGLTVKESGSLVVGKTANSGHGSYYDYNDSYFQSVIDGPILQTGGEIKLIANNYIKSDSITQEGGTMTLSHDNAKPAKLRFEDAKVSINQSGGTMNIEGVIIRGDSGKEELQLVINQSGSGTINMSAGTMFDAKGNYQNDVNSKKAGSMFTTGNGPASVIKQSGSGTININSDYSSATFNVEQTGKGGNITIGDEGRLQSDALTLTDASTFKIQGKLELNDGAEVTFAVSSLVSTYTGNTGGLVVDGGTLAKEGLVSVKVVFSDDVVMAALTELTSPEGQVLGSRQDVLIATNVGDAITFSAGTYEKEYDLGNGTTATVKFDYDFIKPDESNQVFANVTATVTGTGTTPAVPEPATATLSLLALAGLCARRRRK